MNTEQTKYKVVNGTFYDEGTPDEVCRVLEYARERRRRLAIAYQAESAPEYGYVGRSMGPVKAPLLIHFADQDERINAAWPAYEAALKAAGVRFEAQRYPGTQHGFHNDTTPRYDAAAARLAWSRTLAFLARQLKA